ncbi:MAG: DUF302 domain-containing protein [Frankia sp.]|nr:DUF302 domain-containing protein [Frankia sp.]
MDYGRRVRVALTHGEAVRLVRAALAAQGFGVLTEIDVRATMKAKLGEDMEDYVILGACNPPLAHRALGVDRQIGLLLPCNVVVRADGDRTAIEVLDPTTMVALTGRAELAPVAAEAGARLDAAVAALVAEAETIAAGTAAGKD